MISLDLLWGRLSDIIELIGAVNGLSIGGMN